MVFRKRATISYILVAFHYLCVQIQIHTFNQSRFPRINKESFMPIARNCNTSTDLEAWYPPGHGDFYESFYNSGLLEEFIKQVRNQNERKRKRKTPTSGAISRERLNVYFFLFFNQIGKRILFYLQY